MILEFITLRKQGSASPEDGWILVTYFGIRTTQVETNIEMKIYDFPSYQYLRSSATHPIITDLPL